MNVFDWLSVVMIVLTAIGFQFIPNDYNQEIQRAAQIEGVTDWPGSATSLAVGGDADLIFTDSAQTSAHDRAMIARQAIARAIFHHDLPGHYVALALRASGNDSHAEIHYLDHRLVTVTASDAKFARVGSARALAETWRNELDAAFKRMPNPLPDSWLAITGEVAGAAVVSDNLLGRAAATVLSPRPGEDVRVSAKGGMLVLEGRVTSEAQSERLETLMGQIPGARGVINRLKVAP